MFLASRLLLDHGFANGFSLRTGGASDPPFDSLNLGRSVGDDPERVAENRRRFAAAVGYAEHDLYEVSQVHGRTVRVIGAEEPPHRIRSEEADALVATSGGRALAVRVADCIPLLLADPETGAAAAVHAGWRGVEAAIATVALDAMRRIGARSETVLAAIGPHIRVGAFEVGEDVAVRLAGVGPGEEVVVRGRERPHVDLSAILRHQLQRAGVAGERIDDVGGCTFAERERFFSFRRDGQRSGRHLGVVVSRR
jgi:YfiH family protein